MDNKAIAPLAAVLVVALAVAPVATVAVAQSAIPGEALYGLKRASEALTAPAALDQLDRRVGELEALVDRKADPGLIEQTARDIEAAAAAAAEASTAEQIDRAQRGLTEAKTRIGGVMDRLMEEDEDHPALDGLQTALDAIARADDGLDTAKEALDLGADGELPDVAP